MKYWSHAKIHNGYGLPHPDGIMLEEALSLHVREGKVVLAEEIDQHSILKLSKDEMIALFEEAIDWVKSSTE